MNRIYIALAITIMVLSSNWKLSAASSAKQQLLVNKVVAVKNKAELKRLIGSNIRQSIRKWKLDYSDVFLEAIRTKPKEQVMKAIVSFLCDTVEATKYSGTKRYINHVLEEIVKSRVFALEVKEVAMGAFKVTPNDWCLLSDYFKKPENQKTLIFKQYLNWRMSDLKNDDNFEFLSKVFDNLDEIEQIKVLKGIKPQIENSKSKRIKFLTRIANSGKYGSKLQKIAKQYLKARQQGEADLIARLANAESVVTVENILKNKLQTWEDWQNFDYTIFKQAIEKASSFDSQKAVVLFLRKNCSYSRNLIGDLLLSVVTFKKYPLALRKIPLTIDVFRYTQRFQKGLLKYFSVKNRNSQLYKIFFNLVVEDSHDKDNLCFIENVFHNLPQEEQLRIVKDIDIDTTGLLKEQYDFFEKIAFSKNYDNAIRSEARKQLAKLRKNKLEYEKEQNPTVEELMTNDIKGLERIAEKMGKRKKKGKPITSEDIKKINEMLDYYENIVFPEEYYKKLNGNKRLILETKKKLREIRIRIEKIIQDENNLKK